MDVNELIKQIEWIGMSAETQSVLMQVGTQTIAIDFFLGMGKVMVYEVGDLNNGRSFEMANLDNANQIIITEKE